MHICGCTASAHVVYLTVCLLLCRVSSRLTCVLESLCELYQYKSKLTEPVLASSEACCIRHHIKRFQKTTCEVPVHRHNLWLVSVVALGVE